MLVPCFPSSTRQIKRRDSKWLRKQLHFSCKNVYFLHVGFPRWSCGPLGGCGPLLWTLATRLSCSSVLAGLDSALCQDDIRIWDQCLVTFTDWCLFWHLSKAQIRFVGWGLWCFHAMDDTFNLYWSLWESLQCLGKVLSDCKKSVASLSLIPCLSSKVLPF